MLFWRRVLVLLFFLGGVVFAEGENSGLEQRKAQAKKAWFYLEDSNHVFDEVEKTFPDLADRSRKVRALYYASHFWEARVAAEEEYKRDSTEQEYKAAVEDSRSLDAKIRTREAAEGLLDELEGEAKGTPLGDPKVFVLAFVPRYREHPDQEMADGWKSKIQSRDWTEDGGGPDISFFVPASWKPRAGEAPGMAVVFASANGLGDIGMDLLVFNGAPGRRPFTEEEMRKLWSREGFSRAMGPGVTLVQAEDIVLGGHKGVMFVADFFAESGGKKHRIRATYFGAVFEGKLVRLDFLLSEAQVPGGDVEGRHGKLLDSFKKIAGSLVYQEEEKAQGIQVP